jgi:hypothetical protein
METPPSWCPKERQDLCAAEGELRRLTSVGRELEFAPSPVDFRYPLRRRVPSGLQIIDQNDAVSRLPESAPGTATYLG